jgi:putative MATE family efflux protein
MASAPASRGSTDLTQGPIFRTLLVFSLPVLGANLLQSSAGAINAVWVGRFLGETALAATSNANILLFLLLGAIFGVGIAATVLIGQSIGRRDVDAAKRVVGTTASFFAFASAVLAVCGYLFTPSILALMGTPAEARPLAEDYLRVIFLAMPAMYFLSFLMMALRGAGDSRTPFWFMLLAAILDVIINPVLILGMGPFPELGIAGAATATLISQLVALLAMLGWIYARRYPLRLTGPELRYLRPDPVLLKAIVLKGIPMGLQMLVISGAAVVMIGLVNRFGTQTAAAYGIAAQLWGYLQMPAMAIGAAASSMAAQNVGAQLWHRVRRTAVAGVAINVALTGTLVLVLWQFDRQLLGLFLTDPATIALAEHINALVSWSFVLFGITIVLFGVVRATGAVTAPLYILFTSLVAVRIPFAELLIPSWGAEAVWWSFPVGSVVSVTLALLYYRFGSWRTARMIERRPHAEAQDGGMGVSTTP